MTNIDTKNNTLADLEEIIMASKDKTERAVILTKISEFKDKLKTIEDDLKELLNNDMNQGEEILIGQARVIKLTEKKEKTLDNDIFDLLSISENVRQYFKSQCFKPAMVRKGLGEDMTEIIYTDKIRIEYQTADQVAYIKSQKPQELKEDY